MQNIDITSDELVRSLLELSQTEPVCILDSCGVNHLDSHLLIAGIRPLETLEITDSNPEKTLHIFNQKLSDREIASIFTISYDFGLKLENLTNQHKNHEIFSEPDIFLTTFECLIIHDYDANKTYLKGNKASFDEIKKTLYQKLISTKASINNNNTKSVAVSNFTKNEYISAVEKIQEYIRKGEAYQTNLTQQFKVKLQKDLSPQSIYEHLRNSHAAPFSAFIKRQDDCVVSISPERFINISNIDSSRLVSVSPIKGTKKRGKTTDEDIRIQNSLISSEKDRAENTMIVDLLRNDLGRICEFGSVRVEKLYDLEKHPTLFHLVSTVKGNLRKEITFADIIKAIFPCGSITGCPKIRTMQIIDEIETVDRGLSMGAIGYCDFDNSLDMSVAIRTMIIREQEAVFNAGGGIVIDSDPEDEYEESLLKAKAIFTALNAD